jgi:hypothetical protein
VVLSPEIAYPSSAAHYHVPAKIIRGFFTASLRLLCGFRAIECDDLFARS